MKLSQEAVTEYNQIHSYDDNSVIVRPQNQHSLETIETNFILTPNQLISDWPVGKIQYITAEQLAQLKRLDPEVILFATGSGPTMDVLAVSQDLMQSHIGAEFMELGAACRTFNLLVAEHRKVVLAVSFDAV